MHETRMSGIEFDPERVNPEHLYAGTPKENARDRGLRSLRCPNCGWHLEHGDRLTA
jgi:hypothetical protein